MASEVMHHARARDGSDEHIIQRASLLTEPIYFDNQFTIVPVAAWKNNKKEGPGDLLGLTNSESHHALLCEGKQRRDWRCSQACYQMPGLD